MGKLFFALIEDKINFAKIDNYLNLRLAFTFEKIKEGSI
jgi:hypothetical protein